MSSMFRTAGFAAGLGGISVVVELLLGATSVAGVAAVAVVVVAGVVVVKSSERMPEA